MVLNAVSSKTDHSPGRQCKFGPALVWIIWQHGGHFSAHCHLNGEIKNQPIRFDRDEFPGINRDDCNFRDGGRLGGHFGLGRHFGLGGHGRCRWRNHRVQAFDRGGLLSQERLQGRFLSQVLRLNSWHGWVWNDHLARSQHKADKYQARQNSVFFHDRPLLVLQILDNCFFNY